MCGFAGREKEGGDARGKTLVIEEREYPLEKMVSEGKLPVEIEGRYDIRSFLKWEGIDIDEYKELIAQGHGHHHAMRQLHEKAIKD